MQKAAGAAAEKNVETTSFVAYKAAPPRSGQGAGAPHEGRAAQKTLHRPLWDTVIAAHTKAETVASPQGITNWRWSRFTAALPEMLGGSADLTRLQPDQHQIHAEPAL
jgi:transketolase